MARVGKRAGRNFGFGRQLSYAGPQALKDLFGDGHFATVKAHSCSGLHLKTSRPAINTIFDRN